MQVGKVRTEKDLVIKKLKENQEYLRKEYGIEKIGLFGSVVRNEQNEDSDIDILVKFQKGKTPSLIKYMKLKFFLEKTFGRKIDLVTDKAVKPRLRGRIFKEVVYV